MRALGFLGLVLFMGALTMVGATYVGEAIGNAFEAQAARIEGRQ